MKTTLIVGCSGQIGRALMNRLATDEHRVIGVDIIKFRRAYKEESPDAHLITTDATSLSAMEPIIRKFKPEWVFHLPAILSGAAEKNIHMAVRTMRVNVDSFTNMLRLAFKYGYRLFCPSTIAVFGSETPKVAPDTTVMTPRFLYGSTKVYDELLGTYFNQRYSVDYRSMRLPGVIAPNTSAGTGTTDYAIDMIRAASQEKPYECYLRKHTVLPMAHIDDCLEGVINLMGADRSRLSRCVYNIQSMSFDPVTLRAEIERQTGRSLNVNYKPDHRQAIAESWPHRLDDTNARRDWNWSPKHDITATVRSILEAGKSRGNK